MRDLLFAVTATLGLLLMGGFSWSALCPPRRIWPAPDWKLWRFWFVWILTIGSLAGFFIVSLFDWDSFVFSHWSHFIVGGVLFVAGASFALWGVAALGFRTSAGLKGELVTTGPYRWSRNPQYLGDFGVLIGWAILSNSNLAFLLAAIGVACFYMAAVCEEPWVRREYGERYNEYQKRVARFIGWRTSP